MENENIAQGPLANNASVAPNMVEKKHFKKILLIPIVILLAAFSYSGVFAYEYFFNSPEQVINKAFLKISDIKSLEYSGEINGNIKTDNATGLIQSTEGTSTNDNKIVGSILIKFNGQSDFNDENNIKSNLVLDLSSDKLLGSTSSINLETKIIGKDAYLKLNEIPNIAFFDLGFLENQWIKIDYTKEISSQLGSISYGYGEDTKKIEEIKNIFKEKSVIEKIEKLDDEKIENNNTRHYKITFNKEELKNNIIKSYKVIVDKDMTEEEKQSFDKGFNDATIPVVEIWIGKKDYYLYKISFAADVKETENIKASGNAGVVLSFKNFNNAVTIETPQEFKTIEEITAELFGGMTLIPAENSQTTSGIDSNLTYDMSLDTDSDGLTDLEEGIYGTNPNKPDTDGDGYEDGDEVKAGYNPNGAGKLQ